MTTAALTTGKLLEVQKGVWIVFLFFVLLGAAETPVFPAEDEGGTNGPAERAPTKQEQGRVQIGAELRWRFEFRDNTDLRPAEDFERFLGQRLRLSFRVKAHPHLSFYVQGQDTELFGARQDKVIHELGVNLHQAFLDWNPSGGKQWEFRLGRQELSYGEERLVGPLGWDNVARSFNALRMRHRAGLWTADLFAGRVVEVRRAGAPRRRGDQDLYGLYATRAPDGDAPRTELYGLFLRDGLRLPGEQGGNRPESTRIITMGLRHLRQPATGWRYQVEHAWQLGWRGPDPHRAVMLVSSAGYAWGSRLRPRLGVEYDFATGDNNPRDGNSGEFHNLFPTNHPYYGYADLFGLRNLHAVRFTAALRPLAGITLEADYHNFWLDSRRGPWKNATGRVLGQDREGLSGRHVGQEVDLTARIPLHPHLSLLAGYSVFVPGRFAVRTRGPELHHFGYIQTALGF